MNKISLESRSDELLPGGSAAPELLNKILAKPVALQELPGVVRETTLWQGAVPLSAEPSVESVRELVEEEVALLEKHPAESTRVAPVYSVQKLKARHHEFARLMAAGVQDVEIARVMECTPPTLRALRRSPAFIGLLTHYMKARDEEAVNIAGRIEEAAGLALSRLEEVLTNSSGAEIPLGELRKVTEGLLDRAGHSPIQRSKNLNLNMPLSPADIQAIKDLHAAPSASVVLSRPREEDPPTNSAGAADSQQQPDGAPA